MTVEYGRKPYLSKTYNDMIRNITDKQINDQIVLKQSEMKKPYMSDSYEEMEQFYPPIFGGAPKPGLPDWPIPPYPEPEWPPFVPPPPPNPPPPPPNPPPWYPRPPFPPPPNPPEPYPWYPPPPFPPPLPGSGLFEVHAGCDMTSLPFDLSKGSTYCVSLSDSKVTHSTNKTIVSREDMIAKWEVSGPAILTSSNQSKQMGACLKVNANASVGDIVRITATTKSGSTCDSMGWVTDDCAGITIGYTTTQMSVTQTQTLTAVGESGQDLTWSLSGGGSLSTNTGASTVYTAPATNANCSSNPTITLSCGGGVVSTLKIAVNAVSGVAYAGQDHTANSIQCDPYTGVTCSCTRLCPLVNCDGSWQAGVPRCGAGAGATFMDCTKSYPPRVCNSGCTPIVFFTDARTLAQKAAGCCPSQLL